ncbi:MAG: ABC transporter ATP-binding protein [Desulfobacterales bacterium]|nr:ABC transporter ATP-binding protein [Desulfobacterales bacterium]
MTAIFEVQHLYFAYSNHDVLQNMNFALLQGKFYGILGPNGCGKTTLLDILSGYRKVNRGDIMLRGKNINTYPKHELAKIISVVAQQTEIHFPYTVQEIVMMGRYPYIDRFSQPSKTDYDFVYSIMEQTDILSFAHQSVTQLSGGEKQRVLFARAMAQNTDILMLDEATANLDIHYTLTLLDWVSMSRHTKTIIAVMHDINLAARYCTDFLFMKDGKLIHMESVDEILNADYIHEVYDVHAKIYFESFINAKQVVYKR